jgi:sporulation protein YlmC with PRC-barrel domain
MPIIPLRHRSSPNAAAALMFPSNLSRGPHGRGNKSPVRALFWQSLFGQSHTVSQSADRLLSAHALRFGETTMKMRSLFLATATVVAIGFPVLAQTTVPTPSSPAISAPSAVSTPMTSTEVFYSDAMTPANWRASEAMGLAVYNRTGERIGEIDDMILDGSGRVAAAVVGVGGFLGMGERKVAVAFRAFEMTREANGTPRLMVDLSKASLQAAPEYKPAPAAKRN